MQISVLTWNKKCWFSFIVLFIILISHTIFLKFPIFDSDSVRYINGAMFLKPSPHTPMLVCYLLHPLVSLFGCWGFVLFQQVLIAYTLTMLLLFLKQPLWCAVGAIIISGMGYVSSAILMDSYTAIGLLALFLILNNCDDIVMYFVLSLCFLAHYENMVLFPLTALGFYFFTRDRRQAIKTISVVFLVFAILTGALFSRHQCDKKKLVDLTKFNYEVIASRFLGDCPQAYYAYILEHPDRKFALYRQTYDKIMQIKKYSHLNEFIWGDDSFTKQFPEKAGEESKMFVYYVLQKHTVLLLFNITKNAAAFILDIPDIQNAFYSPEKALEKAIRTNCPGQIVKIFLQHKQTPYFNGLIDKLYRVFYICVLCSFVLYIGWLCVRVPLDNNIHLLLLFSLLSFIINAIIWGGFVGIYERHQIRILLLQSIATIFFIKEIIQRYRKYRLGAYAIS